MRVYVGRFERLLDGHTIFGGVTYTDAHVMIGGLLVVCAALVLGAVISGRQRYIWRARRGRLALPWRSFPPRLVCYVVLSVVGWYVGNFIVKPNELVREEPYISHNIEMTRRAYGFGPVLATRVSR